MRYFLLFLLFFLASSQAFAQTAPSSLARAESLVAASQAALRAQRLAAEASAATDTAAALHQFYAARRHRGLLIAGGFVAVTGLGLAIDQAHPRAYQGFYNIATVVFVALPVLAANFFYHAQYSHKRERRAIAAFEAHYLPAATKARLVGKFFQLPPSTVQR